MCHSCDLTAARFTIYLEHNSQRNLMEIVPDVEATLVLLSVYLS